MTLRERFLKATFEMRIAAHGLSSDCGEVTDDVSEILIINLLVPPSLESTLM